MKFHGKFKNHNKKFKLKFKSGSKKSHKNSKKFGLKIKAGTKQFHKKTKKTGLKIKIHAKPVVKKVKLRVKTGAKLKVKGGAKLKFKIKSKRHLQTATSTPVVSGNTNGVDTAQYKGDVSVPNQLEGDADQNAPAYANLMKLAAASFIVVLSTIF